MKNCPTSIPELFQSSGTPIKPLKIKNIRDQKNHKNWKLLKAISIWAYVCSYFSYFCYVFLIIPVFSQMGLGPSPGIRDLDKRMGRTVDGTKLCQYKSNWEIAHLKFVVFFVNWQGKDFKVFDLAFRFSMPKSPRIQFLRWTGWNSTLATG